MKIKKYAEEVIDKLNNLSYKEFDKLLGDTNKDNKNIESNKFDGGLMGLEYCIYYCEECETDFAVRLSSNVVCCPSCKSENIISGYVQDFC